jgi:hypothetical protein
MHTTAITAPRGLHCGEFEHAVPQHIEIAYKNKIPGGAAPALSYAGVRRDASVTCLFTFLSTALARKAKCLFAARVTTAIAMLDIKSEN